MAFRSEFSGVCAACGGHYPERTRIMWRTGEGITPGWGHEFCPDPLAVERPPCPDCFLVHPDGACDR